MAYCRKCGTQIDDEAIICPSCGVQQRELSYTVKDSGSIGWAILGFLIPIVGLTLWLVWADEKPESAKMSGIGALASILLSIVSVFFVLSFMFI